MMNSYYCWITALLPSYQDQIVAGMARKGYMIGPAAKDNKVTYFTSEDSLSSVIAIHVYKTIGTNIDEIYSDLIAVLYDMKAKYYSVIISAASEAKWTSSNID